CVEDVAEMRTLLIGSHGFRPSHVSVLVDNGATRDGILRAVRKHLVDRARPGDVAVLYYSGHGSESYDPDRINNRDQTLVPHDGRDPAGRIDDVSGADLNEALRDLRTTNCVVILDS